MSPGSQRIIVINGVRYHVAIRVDSNWSYLAEWWNHQEFHKHKLEDRVQSASKAEQDALDEIRKVHLSREPWVHVEMAGARD